LDGWIERHRTLIVIVLGYVVSLGAMAFLLRCPHSSERPVLQLATALPTATPAPLRVYVSGAVVHPDVYRLPPGAIVKDALAAAGGALPEADLTRVNLAQQLFDQQQVHIPPAGESSPPQQGAPPAFGEECLDINRATLEELDRLPGIGPNYARRIVEYRTTHGPFQDVEELIQVKGIGPVTLEGIRDLVCVR